MHGLIFTSFQNFVRAEYGSAQAERILEGEPIYLLSETYDDERLLGLVSRTAEVVDADPDAIVHDFGVFTGETIFPRIYPAYYAIASDTRSFLLGIESHIHQLVRATIPNAEPPQLRVSELGDDGVSIVYTSPRRLCVLLRGLAEGTARHYQERVEIEEQTCMLRGDDACRFEIRLQPA